MYCSEGLAQGCIFVHRAPFSFEKGVSYIKNREFFHVTDSSIAHLKLHYYH